MYEPESRARRYLNDMIYGKGSLAELKGTGRRGVGRAGAEASPAGTRRAITGFFFNYARALAGARARPKLRARGQERPREPRRLVSQLLLFRD